MGSEPDTTWEEEDTAYQPAHTHPRCLYSRTTTRWIVPGLKRIPEDQYVPLHNDLDRQKPGTCQVHFQMAATLKSPLMLGLTSPDRQLPFSLDSGHTSVPRGKKKPSPVPSLVLTMEF